MLIYSVFVSLTHSIPNAENATRDELEVAARCAPTQKAHNRLRAMIALIEGFGIRSVAKIFGVSVRTVQRWIGRFNERGIDGLLDRPRQGRPPKIDTETAKQCRDLIEHPEKAGQTHWTAVKFHGYLREELNLEIGYSTLVRFLHKNSYRLKVPRPWPDRQDEELRTAFCEHLKALMADSDIEVWFADESGFEGDPRPRRQWVKRGVTNRVSRSGTHLRMNVTGMVCPRTGEAFFLEFTHSDTDVFQAFLDEANKIVNLTRPRQILIVDNASWHRAKRLNWGRFEPLYLPPYSPDLNPIERVWLLIKAEWFANFYAKDHEQLIDHLDKALIWVMQRQTENSKTCSVATNN